MIVTNKYKRGEAVEVCNTLQNLAEKMTPLLKCPKAAVSEPATWGWLQKQVNPHETLGLISVLAQSGIRRSINIIPSLRLVIFTPSAHIV